MAPGCASVRRRAPGWRHPEHRVVTWRSLGIGASPIGRTGRTGAASAVPRSFGCTTMPASAGVSDAPTQLRPRSERQGGLPPTKPRLRHLCERGPCALERVDDRVVALRREGRGRIGCVAGPRRFRKACCPNGSPPRSPASAGPARRGTARCADRDREGRGFGTSLRPRRQVRARASRSRICRELSRVCAAPARRSRLVGAGERGQ